LIHHPVLGLQHWGQCWTQERLAQLIRRETAFFSTTLCLLFFKVSSWFPLVKQTAEERKCAGNFQTEFLAPLKITTRVPTEQRNNVLYVILIKQVLKFIKRTVLYTMANSKMRLFGAMFEKMLIWKKSGKFKPKLQFHGIFSLTWIMMVGSITFFSNLVYFLKVSCWFHLVKQTFVTHLLTAEVLLFGTFLILSRNLLTELCKHGISVFYFRFWWQFWKRFWKRFCGRFREWFYNDFLNTHKKEREIQTQLLKIENVSWFSNFLCILGAYILAIHPKVYTIV
jgi:hypothetical protein